MTDMRENAERGRAIEERARQHGIYSDRELEAMTIEVDRKVPRKSISRAYKGLAGDKIYERLEDALSLWDERTSGSHDVGPEPNYIEFRLTGDLGVDVIVKAPASMRVEVEESVTRLIRELSRRS